MVLVSSHHALSPVHIALLPQGIITDPVHVFGVSHLVAFQVSLLHNIKAETVTQIQEVRVRRIMSRAYGIDVILFHQIQICQHIFLCNASACLFIPVMPVYAF